MSQLQRLTIAPSQLENKQILLTSGQQHYLSRVLRMEAGDRFIATNGQGQSWMAKLQGERAEILELIFVRNELPIAITLMVALPKGNGFDEVVRQATALGVSRIIPTISDRTLLHPSPQKLDRWRRIATEAAEQSERQFVPEILQPDSFTTLITNCQDTQKYICVERGDFPPLLNCLIHTPQTALTVATGPEGGWTPAEVEKAIAVEFQPVSLGRRIMTAVLAPIVALSLVAATVEMGTMKREGIFLRKP